MVKIISILLTGVITSLYFFPFEFTFLPGINTKMAMAAFSLFILIINLARNKNAKLDTDFLNLSVMALLVSLASFIAITYNNTRDYTYVSYIMSMWVWLGGAYAAVTCIRATHGRASVELIANYLIAVCVAQCFFAIMIDQIPAFKNLVDSYVSGLGFVDLDKMGEANRLYGIGAGLDVAGTRFAAVLLMIAYIVSHSEKTTSRRYMFFYLISFVIITLIGNMIARTTTIGVALALAYWVYLQIFKRNEGTDRMWKWILKTLVISLPLIIYVYSTNRDMEDYIRFAFEGFFSLVEKGTWEVHSNDMLKDMVVFPDNLKTWLVGDGYIMNPYRLDPYYIGPNFGGYYMATDIGYLRFLFYFGIFGVLAFCYFMYHTCVVCMNRFDKQKLFFIMVLLVNYIVWLKVSTDIFLVFALFLCVNKEENDEYYEQIALKEE